MQNPLFTGLVVYALNSAESSAVEHFQPRLLHLLKDLKITSDWEELPWYEGAMKSWSQIPPEVFIDLLSGFREAMVQADLNQLLALGTAVRLELMVSNAQPTEHKVVNVFATYTVQWEDGRQVEYNCRPHNIAVERIEVPILAKLSRMFSEHFIEAMCERPGLDSYYANVAKPFDEDAFLELMQFLTDHVEKMPEEQQADYQNIIVRMTHQFGPAPDLSPTETKPIEPIEGGGGFQ